jgi:hypothetical protein
MDTARWTRCLAPDPFVEAKITAPPYVICGYLASIGVEREQSGSKQVADGTGRLHTTDGVQTEDTVSRLRLYLIF